MSASSCYVIVFVVREGVWAPLALKFFFGVSMCIALQSMVWRSFLWFHVGFLSRGKVQSSLLVCLVLAAYWALLCRDRIDVCLCIRSTSLCTSWPCNGEVLPLYLYVYTMLLNMSAVENWYSSMLSHYIKRSLRSRSTMWYKVLPTMLGPILGLRRFVFHWARIAGARASTV